MDNDNVITPSQLLVKAKEILETNGWGQGHYARDKDGLGIDATHPDAKCFCAVGAILRADGATYRFNASDTAQEAIRCLYLTVGRPIPIWNDAWMRTKDEVLEAFGKAALLCKDN